MPQHFEFDIGDTPGICAVVNNVITTPNTWCNIERGLVEDMPDESPLFGFLAARGPANPFATVMGPTGRNGEKPAQIGAQHRAGQKALQGLAEHGLALPENWRVKQDHPRRGIVVLPTSESTVEEMWMWLNAAMAALARAPIGRQVTMTAFGFDD